jgi:hypothetical protein
MVAKSQNPSGTIHFLEVDGSLVDGQPKNLSLLVS